MEIPKTITTYCPSCNSHELHKLKHYTVTGMQNARTLAFGVRRNVRKHKRGYGGKAKFPKTPKKQTRKACFTAECEKCKKKHYYVYHKRMKKPEFKK